MCGAFRDSTECRSSMFWKQSAPNSICVANCWFRFGDLTECWTKPSFTCTVFIYKTVCYAFLWVIVNWISSSWLPGAFSPFSDTNYSKQLQMNWDDILRQSFVQPYSCDLRYKNLPAVELCDCQSGAGGPAWQVAPRHSPPAEVSLWNNSQKNKALTI